MNRRIALAGIVQFAAGLFMATTVGARQQARNGAVAIAPRFRPATGPLPPLPVPGYPPARPMQVVHEVYEFAARHPEVLHYIPCYCGCERFGHGGNHDCFVQSRDANGRITAWEEHGYGCTVCIDVARDSMLMYNSGASVNAIRAGIDKKYGTLFPSRTPTPDPPKPAAKAR